MSEKNSNKTFSNYLDEISNLAEYLKTYPDDSVSGNAITISKNVQELKKALKGIRLSLIFLLTFSFMCLTVAVFALSSNKFRSYFVDDQTTLKDSLLSLSNDNSLLTYRRDKGKIVTYGDLVKENDTLLNKYYEYKAKYRSVKSDLDLCNILLKSANNNEKYYKNNADFYEENSRYYEDLNSKRQLEDIKDLTKSIQHQKKTDSGKILLDVFRKNMKYDPKTKTWNIDLNRK